MTLKFGLKLGLKLNSSAKT